MIRVSRQVVVVLFALVACVPDLASVPCARDENCPNLAQCLCGVCVDPGAALPALGVVEDGVIGVVVAKAHLGPVDPGPEVMGVAEVGPARGGVGQRDLAGAAEAVLQATLRPLAEGDPGAAGAAA